MDSLKTRIIHEKRIHLYKNKQNAKTSRKKAMQYSPGI
jgi:hypothetical protein